ncbi:hypothetical protein QUC31_007248 [Theobroma cacao]
MKTTIAAALLLSLFAIQSDFFGVANATNKPVLDTDGEELRTGVEYYVVSALWAAGGGGLALGRSRNQSCPDIVVQRRSELDYGIPVIFSPVKPNDVFIRVSTDLIIEFVPLRDSLCLTTAVWKLDDYDQSTGKWWVIAGRVAGDAGPHTFPNWFKIEKNGVFGYKFTYCPSVCDSCTTLCSDIGRYEDNGQIRLGLGDQGWPFVFTKATRAIKQVVGKQ